MQLSNVTLTARDGRVSNIEQCFIRGSKVRFIVLPGNSPPPPPRRFLALLLCLDTWSSNLPVPSRKGPLQLPKLFPSTFSSGQFLHLLSSSIFAVLF